MRTIKAFKALDEAEMLIGYLDGFGGRSPASGATASYAHGWRNGMIESDRLPVDEAYLQLQHAFECAGNAD